METSTLKIYGVFIENGEPERELICELIIPSMWVSNFIDREKHHDIAETMSTYTRNWFRVICEVEDQS